MILKFYKKMFFFPIFFSRCPKFIVSSPESGETIPLPSQVRICCKYSLKFTLDEVIFNIF